MKFDVFSWNEVKPNVQTQKSKGRLRVLCSQPSPFYVSAQGVEVLAGYGTSFDFDVSEEVTWRVDAPKGVRVFVYAPPLTVAEPEGEVFTNIDRMPHESGSVNEVLRASRQLELQRRSMLREMREEAARLRASMRPDPALIEPEAEPAVEPAPAPAAADGGAQ
ncbi:hypothetical protein [Paracoccus aminovorans]|uniref:hypothetical protein n=1 Tax=Paracoccus aminovorans TaxID=34004 RepID=UPI002B25E5E1|nr:hypothetical protein [Paracoccus aminovorans]